MKKYKYLFHHISPMSKAIIVPYEVTFESNNGELIYTRKSWYVCILESKGLTSVSIDQDAISIDELQDQLTTGNIAYKFTNSRVIYNIVKSLIRGFNPSKEDIVKFTLAYNLVI
jgi:hypothetical protein